VVFTHTEVDDAFEGRGVGSVLVHEALEAVRAEGGHVVALCPFVREYVERHPEYAELLR
jgi:predicted GNAT family acetyltransferase